MHRLPPPVSLVVALACGSAGVLRSAAAATHTWVGPVNGVWSTPANWNPAGQPAAGDTANLTPTNGLSYNLTYQSSTNDLLGSVLLDASGTTALTLTQAQDTLSTDDLTVGRTGHATWKLSAGVLSIGNPAYHGALVLGTRAGSSGSFNLSNTGQLTIHDGLYIGYGGTGTFTQTGGTVSLTGPGNIVYIAHTNPNPGTGSYFLTGGRLSVHQLDVGEAGNGSLVQSGGTVTVTKLYVSYSAASRGTYLLSAGTLASSDYQTIGGGTGVFTQTGGVNTVGTTLNIGDSGLATISATYSLQSGVLSAAALTVNRTSPGAMLQSGGTFTCNNITVNPAGTFAQTAGRLNALRFDSYGTATLGGVQAWSPGSVLTVHSGSTALNSDAGASAANLAVTLSAGTLSLGSTQHLASLTLAASTTATVAANGARVLVLPSLSLGAGAKLNLTDNDLLYRSSNISADFTTLRNLVITGRNGGAWTGTGITSSSAASAYTAHTNHQYTGLAIVRNSSLAVPFNATTRLFDGQTADANSILIKYTYTGDANLDGKISLDDYLLLDSSLRFGVGTKGWAGGDFSYDNLVNAQDYALIDYVYARQAGSLAAAPLLDLHAQWFGPDYLAALPIPEPATLLLLLAAAPLLCRRRSRA